jgi:acetylornithine deacetylase/succinyl-diaminopimelate desuccinylase family protein
MGLIEKAISRFQEKQAIDLTCSLIEIPSIVGNEGKIGEYLGEGLSKLGVSVEYVEAQKGRPNVIGRLKGQTEEGGLILVGHMDTVPPDQGSGEPWKSDPFKAELRNNRLYGLGSGDMKGGIAAIVVAVKTVLAAKATLKRDLTVIFCVDEEAGSIAGMKYIAERNLAKGNVAIAAEPTDMCLQGWFKGRTWYEIEVKGKTAHCSKPERGINSIHHMVDIIHKIRKIGFKYRKHDLLGDCTTSFGTIEGGTSVKSIPDLCKSRLEVRTVPGQTGQGVRDQINIYIKELKKTDPTLNASVRIIDSKDPMELSPKDPLVDVMQRVGQEAIGRELELGRSGSASGDLYFLWKNMGIPGILFGPGDVGCAHSPNEYIEVDKIVDASKCYIAFILEFCGGSK